MLVGKSIFDDVLDDGNEALSLLPYRVLQDVYFFDFGLHLLLEMLEEEFVPLRVDLGAWLALLQDQILHLLLLFHLHVLDLLLLLGVDLLIQLEKQILYLLVKVEMLDVDVALGLNLTTLGPV